MYSKNRTYQILLIAGLVVGAIALTIGFAAFTTTLTIESSAEVSPASTTLNVVFSSSQSSIATNAPAVSTSGVSGASGGTATLTGTRVSGLKANFTKPNQTVTYTFYVYNASAYTAYLHRINFLNITGTSPATNKVCESKSTSSNPASNNIDNACNGISVTITVDGYSATETKTEANLASANKSINTNTGKVVTVAITYASGSAEADGDFTVEFGDIELKYSSVAPTA